MGRPEAGCLPRVWLRLGGPQSARVSLARRTGGGRLVCPQRPAAAGSEPAVRSRVAPPSQFHSLKAPTLRFLHFTWCQIHGVVATCPETMCFFSVCQQQGRDVRCPWWRCAVGSRRHRQHQHHHSCLCASRGSVPVLSFPSSWHVCAVNQVELTSIKTNLTQKRKKG